VERRDTPVIKYDGEHLEGRLNRRVVYELAIEAFFAALNDASLHLSLTIEAGQIVYVNNRTIAHHRAPFVDAADPNQRGEPILFFNDGMTECFLGLSESRDNFRMQQESPKAAPEAEALLCRHDHDLDLPVRSGKRAAQAGADRRICRVDPGIPDLVHRPEIAHVGDPELCPQELRFVAAAFGQQPIDLSQDLPGLCRDIGFLVVTNLAGEVNDAIVFHGLAHPWADMMAGRARHGLPPRMLCCLHWDYIA
jgi:hypothetical protein